MHLWRHGGTWRHDHSGAGKLWRKFSKMISQKLLFFFDNFGNLGNFNLWGSFSAGPEVHFRDFLETVLTPTQSFIGIWPSLWFDLHWDLTVIVIWPSLGLDRHCDFTVIVISPSLWFSWKLARKIHNRNGTWHSNLIRKFCNLRESNSKVTFQSKWISWENAFWKLRSNHCYEIAPLTSNHWYVWICWTRAPGVDLIITTFPISSFRISFCVGRVWSPDHLLRVTIVLVPKIRNDTVISAPGPTFGRVRANFYKCSFRVRLRPLITVMFVEFKTLCLVIRQTRENVSFS